jgi:hyperosmotically inducible protein
VTDREQARYHPVMPLQSILSTRPLARAASLAIATSLAVACGRPDADVKEAIEAELEKDPVVESLELTVSVSRGIAFVAGETQTTEQQARAVDIARAVDGVSEVVNEMELDENAPLISAVKQALASDPLLAAVPIDVDARNGVVRLISDATDRAQRERAVAVARGVDGVLDVEDRMK